MKKLFKYFLAFTFVFVSVLGHAQNAEMADAFRADGKIYVVVAIILIILAGLIAYLVMLDKKLNKLERLLNSKKKTK